jgi:DNA-directed RNA polymerase specialized sigma24 family protein
LKHSALDRSRCALIQWDQQGYPGSTVAEALGVSSAAMKSQLHRARATVQLSLRDGFDAAAGNMR